MTSYKIGDLVWAKMKGFPKWPGVVAKPTKELKSKKQANDCCIFFFGTNDYAWIKHKCLSPYNEQSECKIKSGGFKDALAAIEHYKLTGEGGPVSEGETTDPFDELIRPSPPPTAAGSTDKKVKKRRISKAGSEALSEDGEDNAGASPMKVMKTGPKKSDTPRGRTPKRPSGSSSLIKKKKSLTQNYAADTTTGESSTFRKSLLDELPGNITARPDSPALDLTTVSQTLLSKSIVPSDRPFGFIGLGVMGSGIVKNLLNSGHEVHVWDRIPERIQEFARVGAKVCMTPSDVMSAADIVFCCVADPVACKELVFGNCGILRETSSSKAFVEMSGIDPATSSVISNAIAEQGGRYLEAQLQGSKCEAEEGTLIILAAGDRSLYNEVSSCFEAIGRASFFLGDVGCATKMYLLLQMMMGITITGLAEGMALAERVGLNQSEVLEVLSISPMNSPLVIEKARAITQCQFTAHLALKHMQKDLRLALALADSLDQPVPTTSTSNEVYKHAKRLGYGNHDASAVYIRARF